MANKIILILSAIYLSVACSCNRQISDKKMLSDITKAEALLDSMPDSTLHILSNIDFDQITNDTLLAKAHYLHGTAKLKLWDYSGAMTPLLYAEKYSELSHNHRLTGMARERIMELHDSIENIDATAKYALKAADAYRECNDTIKQLELLGNSIILLFQTEDSMALNSVAATMKNLSKNINDSTILESVRMADVWTEILSTVLVNERYSDFMYSTHGLRDSLFSGGNWEKMLVGEHQIGFVPNTIHTLSKDLREENMYALAKELESTYLDNYTIHRYGDILITNIIQLDHGIPYALPLTRESFLSEYIPSVERSAIDFYYNETVIKEQTIRYQRNMIIVISVSCGLLICLLVMWLWIMRMRKKQLEEENMRSAMELRIALNQSKDQWLRTLTHLCDTYYKAYAKDSTRSKAAQEALNEINAATESPALFQQLENKLDSEYDGIYSRFRSELTELREDEYKLFMLNALGFSIPTISLLLKEKREVIYNRRVRLRSKIQECTPAHSEQFLKALE